jgi:hypothetical protein
VLLLPLPLLLLLLAACCNVLLLLFDVCFCCHRCCWVPCCCSSSLGPRHTRPCITTTHFHTEQLNTGNTPTLLTDIHVT